MKTLFQSIKITLAFCVLLFGGYVCVLWAVGAIAKPNHGQAEVLELDGKIVGASNVGQTFTSEIYFWGRPSAVDYDGGSSGGSNKGPTNPEYLAQVEERITAFLAAHPYLSRSGVPSEMVTASGSGLDPHISPQAAAVQLKRVAKARGFSEEKTQMILESVTVRPIAGKPYVNVLKLNIALDENKNN